MNSLFRKDQFVFGHRVILCLTLFISFFSCNFLTGEEKVRPISSNTARTVLDVVPPETIGFSSDLTKKIDRLLEDIMRQDETSGIVVAIGRKNKIAYLKAFGFRQIEPKREPMTVDTVFDLASLTKPIATATALAVLYEEERFKLDDPIAKYMPEFGANQKQNITIRNCLTHLSGLSDGCFYQQNVKTKTDLWRAICGSKTFTAPNKEFRYQCVNFITLAFLTERLSGISLKKFTDEKIFLPLGMTDTGFCPNDELKKRCITTENENGVWIKGVVHDPPARKQNGISGNAGLFSTAPDLAVFASMLLGNGTFSNSKRSVTILNRATVDLWTSDFDVLEGKRGLGWDKKSSYSGNRAKNYSDKAFGHGGFTGTVFWVDPGNDLFVIVLGNRLHPKRRKNIINRRAATIGEIAVDSILKSPVPVQ